MQPFGGEDARRQVLGGEDELTHGAVDARADELGGLVGDVRQILLGAAVDRLPQCHRVPDGDRPDPHQEGGHRDQHPPAHLL